MSFKWPRFLGDIKLRPHGWGKQSEGQREAREGQARLIREEHLTLGTNLDRFAGPESGGLGRV